MSKTLKLIYNEPTIENTVPVEVFQNFSPEQFSLADEDSYIMYAGGEDFELEILHNNPSNDIEVTTELQRVDFSDCSLFVLNSAFIIWFNDQRFGIQIPYSSMIFHALQRRDNVDVLYVQLASSRLITVTPKEPIDFVNSVDIVIKRGIRNNREYNPLFEKFDSNIQMVFDALSKCSSFHNDSDSDSDEPNSYMGPQAASVDSPSIEVRSGWSDNFSQSYNETPTQKVNSGDADDLDIDDNSLATEDNTDAGMFVDIGYGPVAGTTRSMEDDVSKSSKSRRLN